ncbi:MAG: hypothetical protein RR413_10820, partial [Christensenellaceae bacterium]
AECGSNYRRIARPSGEVVWRCADWVEKGKRSTCKSSPTIADITIKELICNELGLTKFYKQLANQKVSQIIINNNDQISVWCSTFSVNKRL